MFYIISARRLHGQKERRELQPYGDATMEMLTRAEHLGVARHGYRPRPSLLASRRILEVATYGRVARVDGGDARAKSRSRYSG